MLVQPTLLVQTWVLFSDTGLLDPYSWTQLTKIEPVTCPLSNHSLGYTYCAVDKEWMCAMFQIATIVLIPLALRQFCWIQLNSSTPHTTYPSPTMALHYTQTDDLVHQSIAKQCNAINTELLFFRTKNDLTAYPTSTAVPHLWKYGDVSAVINNAESLLSKEQAERRVLMLINPALST